MVGYVVPGACPADHGSALQVPSGAMRYSAYVAAILLTVLSAAMLLTGHREWTWVLVVAAGLTALGTWDLLQTRHTLRRNYPRSEEYTSELQSRENLVCRLLLEKKKKIINTSKTSK